MTAPPILGAALWEAVAARSGGRCECKGQCGLKHKAGEGRCHHEQRTGQPETIIHVVPAEPMGEIEAMRCDDPARFLGLCDRCHDRIGRRRRSAVILPSPLGGLF